MKRILIAAGTAAVAAAALAPASASAATIASASSCETRIPTYSYTTKANPFPNVIRVTGGTPGARFLVAASDPKRGFDGSAGSQSGNFDAAGNANVVFQFPISYGLGINPSKGRSVNLSVQDYGRQGSDGKFGPIIATGTTKVTTFAADVATRGRSVRSRIPVSASGGIFAGRELSAFVVRGTKSSKVIKRYKLGKANACGYVKKSIRVAKGRRTGSYSVYVQPGKKLDKKSPYVVDGFRVFRRAF